MAEKKRILVVDDEPQITRVLRTALTGSGYEVRTADDGHAGLRSAREWQPDLVVTDISMPNMNGIELCRQLRAETTLPIIVLSVKGEEKTKVEALDAGADDYVTKPVGMDELLARVRRNLARTQPTEDPRQSAPSPSATSKLMRTHSGSRSRTATSGLRRRNSNSCFIWRDTPAGWLRIAPFFLPSGGPTAWNSRNTCACWWHSCERKSTPRTRRTTSSPSPGSDTASNLPASV